MKKIKNIAAAALLALSASLISTMLSASLVLRYCSNVQFQTLGRIFQTFTDKNISDIGTLMKTIKENRESFLLTDNVNILESFGYKAADFTGKGWEYGYLIAAAALCAGILLFLFTFLYWHGRERRQLQALTEYLEKVNSGGQGLLFATKENDSSRLRDEIYKTVTTLYQTRDAAFKAKENYADNLYNIAHQLKTPITAISLSAQMLEEKYDKAYAVQIKRQAARLTHLGDALLLLSRIDAGTLRLEKTKLDVFTVLTLAADNLQELSALSNITIEIPEMGMAEIYADMEWTMEAIMNLFKNCMEHSPTGSKVYCSYEQNPLYVQIRIWDYGKGFEKEDIPHLFERFYRGKNTAKGGIGIGLSLARTIIEMQNGVISAGNLPEGGACFEIHMYCH